MLIVLALIGYFIVLTTYSHLITGKGGNDDFYRGSNKSPWYLVAFGMIGASISGVTFVSVPGMVNNIGMTYMQTCLGFIVGYVIVAFVLLPIYYNLKLTTIYSYLDRRLGKGAYKTGASFFLLSRMTGSAVRFYIVCIIIQKYVFDGVGIPFPITVFMLVFLIWIYTRKGGIKTLVWTDTFQTISMFIALGLIIYKVMGELNLDLPGTISAIASDERSRWFVFDDAVSKQYFWKQFLSGVFIVIVMTGLDQDMMQKNLTCKSLRDAQKDMCTYGVAFVPTNLLFLSLGILLSMLCQQQGLALPVGDELLPMFAASGRLGEAVVVFFTIGIMAASFSSADSALTALTTSYCIDIHEKEDDEKFRKRVHFLMTLVFAVIIIIVKAIGSTSVIDAIYVICSYTYGPLLGLFLYAFFRGSDSLEVKSNKGKLWMLSALCVASPIICYGLDLLTSTLWNYHFGYELLMINGLITFAGLCLLRPEKRH